MQRFNNNVNDSLKPIPIIIFITFGCLMYGLDAVRAPSPVEINKCCRVGEILDQYQQCAIGGTDKWWPLIYLIMKQANFQPYGDAPRFMRARENKRPNCDDPELFKSNVALFSNGTLFLAERNALIDLADYCVDKDVALVCLPTPKGADSLMEPVKLTKIRKCCGHHSIYLSEAGTCTSKSEQHGPIPEHLFQMQNLSHIDLIYGFPVCPPAADDKYVIVDQFREQNLNTKNGTYTLDSHRALRTDEFCIDHTVQASNVIAEKVFACDDIVAVKGVSQKKIEEGRRFIIYSTALIISVIFLSLTLAIGFLLPSNHHVLHCRCQTYYVGCLLIGDLLLAINQLGSLIPGKLCLAIATSMHFFFLAAFFWLNVMCFNIWWTFRDFRPTQLGKKQEKIRLRIYKTYAWGFALLITGIAAIMDILSDSHNLLRPHFGEERCWFVGNMEVFVYFFGPVGFLLLVNIILFASTTRQLMCGLWKQDDVKSSTERSQLGRICLKLLVVMGITWIADVLSWAHKVWTDDSQKNMQTTNMNVITHDVRYYFWYIMDTINALQGVLIFFVVVMQPQVTNAIIRFFTPKKSRSKLNTTHGQHHSSSSNGLASVGDSMANNTFNNTACSKVPMETIC